MKRRGAGLLILWKPVIRYDCAHDYAHRDRYNLKGEQRKEELAMSYAEALTFADTDIKKKTKVIVKRMEEVNAELIYEFDMYVLAHPEFADAIPNGAIVAMQLEGDEEFNEWSRKLAEKHAEEGQPIVFVRIKKLRPFVSRIEELELERVA